MKIGIQTWGTSGDIKPILLLAEALAKRGHYVKVLYTSVENIDYTASSLSNIEIEQVGNFDHTKNSLSNIWNLPFHTQVVTMIEDYFFSVIDNITDGAKQLSEACDLVMGTSIQYPLSAFAEKNNTPFISLDFDYELIPYETVIDPIKEAFNLMFLQKVNTFRSSIGIPEINDVLAETFKIRKLGLVLTSANFYTLDTSWETTYRFSGFLNPPEENNSWQMPPELLDFVSTSKKVVLFTVGSCINYESKPEQLFSIFKEVTEQLDICAIIQTTATFKETIPTDSRIFKLDYAPHHKVLPLCNIVVHHGSAGMVSSTINAGCPSVIIPYAFDQPFWGKELHRLGISPEPINRRDLNSNLLAQQLSAALRSRHMKKKVTQLQQLISQENGIKNAVQIIESNFKK